MSLYPSVALTLMVLDRNPKRSMSSGLKKSKKHNNFSTRKEERSKPTYKIIANSIFVDTNWTEYVEGNPNLFGLILSFLELKHVLQDSFYVCKFWQEYILDNYSEKFKEQYDLENELHVHRKFRIDSVTNNFIEVNNEMMVDDSSQEAGKKVKFSNEKEGTEIIPPELAYDRNAKSKFLFSQNDKVERYALFVRYTCLERSREAIRKYINFLLDEYTQISNKIGRASCRERV